MQMSRSGRRNLPMGEFKGKSTEKVEMSHKRAVGILVSEAWLSCDRTRKVTRDHDLGLGHRVIGR